MQGIPFVLGFAGLVAVAVPMNAQQPSADRIDYRVAIASADSSVVTVEMLVRPPSPTFTIAAHAHPEYDDKYWRYVEDVRAEGANVVRMDSVRWQITSSGKSAITIRYRIRFPVAAAPRAAWRGYLTRQGGMIGGPHTFLYVVGAESASASVQLALPKNWTAATALKRASNGALIAPNIFTLMESPIMVGNMREFRFDVAKVPHRLFYLAGATPIPFDTTAFLGGVRTIVDETLRIFKAAPYPEYLFLVADDAYGGLEHPTSVTMGARSSELAENPHALMPEFAHEFFHTWNLMRFKPAEYRGVDYRVQPPVPSLWFSEGYSIFYSDLLQRRSNMIMETPTRLKHLESLIARYLGDPAFERFSPETISRHEYNSQPGALGNNDPSTHLIGEVLANAIDLQVRAATDGRRTSDDVMRAMNERFSSRGFTGADLERVVADVCGCNIASFFADHVRSAKRIDFNRYLAAIGMEAVATTVAATNDRGEPERDFRIRAWQATPQDTLRLFIWHSESNWAHAGLNMNDRVVSIDGAEVKTWPDFRSRIAAASIGKTLNFVIVRNGKLMEIPAVMAGYSVPRVEVREAPNATPKQKRLRSSWLANL